MHRDTDRSCLIGDRTGDGLTDPPGCIGTELISFGVVKFFHCFDQTQISLLNQIQEQHAASHISFCDADHQTKIGFCQTFFRRLIAVFHPFCQFDFLFCTQKRHFTDLFQIHTNRILDTDPFRYGKVYIFQIHLILFHMHIFIIQQCVVLGYPEYIHAIGFQIFEDQIHLLIIQGDSFKEIIDFLILQHIFLLLA